MTKKKMHSKDIQNHKKPFSKDLLQEEFGSELGDVNSSKIYDLLADKTDKKEKK
ncbi:hypothetical protein ABET51_16965 [Metabacillus fastidiosus]|uniref:hypothetical protein n=1 Tax=Metabacillus fastidiosus TaxID=1458 RepID=UPI002E229AB3|nr:hypothetical protein [Metabacillus fastidiosus]